jgi:hypothetical protein
MSDEQPVAFGSARGREPEPCEKTGTTHKTVKSHRLAAPVFIVIVPLSNCGARCLSPACAGRSRYRAVPGFAPSPASSSPEIVGRDRPKGIAPPATFAEWLRRTYYRIGLLPNPDTLPALQPACLRATRLAFSRQHRHRLEILNLGRLPQIRQRPAAARLAAHLAWRVTGFASTAGDISVEIAAVNHNSQSKTASVEGI